MMPRVVAAETLDGLAEDDPAALRSRRDLQRVHRAMGTHAIVARALRALTASRPAGAPLRLLELGAGDGSLMLRVAHALKGEWPAVQLTLLDRQNLVNASTVASYATAGWTATSQVLDVFDWVASDAYWHWDLIVTNLFLHHFDGPALASLLAAIESRTERFFACEPRRARLALAASHLIGVIGAHAVTRQDAVLSVHAGFRATEISALWPGLGARWTLNEYPAGLFSHCFSAERMAPQSGPTP
jgi:HPt (histidine-containing phosphotransfer) domain-containing protein